MSDQACDGCADPKHFSAAHSESYLSPSPGPPSASKLAPLQLTPRPFLHLLHLPPPPSSSSSRSYSSSPVAVHLERALRAFGATIPTHRGQPEATTARLRRLTGDVSSGPYCRLPFVRSRTVAPCPVPQVDVSRVSCEWGPTCFQGPQMPSCFR